jgi:hypothetical protein
MLAPILRVKPVLFGFSALAAIWRCFRGRFALFRAIFRAIFREILALIGPDSRLWGLLAAF